MTKLLKLAWRDIWRNRRRSLLTMGAIVFGVIFIAMSTSIQHGTFDAMEELIVRLYAGDLQVHRTGYDDERTLSYSLEPTALLSIRLISVSRGPIHSRTSSPMEPSHRDLRPLRSSFS